MPILAELVYMDNQKIESCTQVDVRYYLQYQTKRPKPYLPWANYEVFPKGFKTENSAIRTLKKARKKSSHLPNDFYRVIKQTRTIEIKTTTDIKVIA
jgi:hypothetical protein